MSAPNQIDHAARPKTQSTRWELEKSMNIIASIGQKDCDNAFITERATEVLDYYWI
jgi:hypothetical protein